MYCQTRSVNRTDRAARKVDDVQGRSSDLHSLIWRPDCNSINQRDLAGSRRTESNQFFTSARVLRTIRPVEYWRMIALSSMELSIDVRK